MSVLERKNHLHQLVVETHDEIILEKVELLFEELLKDARIDWWDSISDEEKKAIEAGKADAEAGRTVSHDDVKKKALAILNR
jgi:predicted transcriptional regulator